MDGAVLVAAATTRYEIRRDRRRSQEIAAVESAGALISLLAGMPEELEDLKHLQPVGGTGVDYDHVVAWRKRRSEVARAVILHGTFLPRHLESRADELVPLLDELFSVDEDHDLEMLIWVDVRKDKTEAAAAAVRSFLNDLRAYRRDPSSPSKSSKSSKPSKG